MLAPTDSKDPLGPLALLVLKVPKVLPAPPDLSAARPDLRDQPDPLDLREPTVRKVRKDPLGQPAPLARRAQPAPQDPEAQQGRQVIRANKDCRDPKDCRVPQARQGQVERKVPQAQQAQVDLQDHRVQRVTRVRLQPMPRLPTSRTYFSSRWMSRTFSA